MATDEASGGARVDEAPGGGVIRVGVDIGGTFTDLTLLTPDGRLLTRKTPTTPDAYGRAVVHGISALLEAAGLTPAALGEIIHGTTVATNAVLEGTGARTGLLTTRGFRDVLEIRRIRSPELYNPLWEKPKPLVPRRHRLEVTERIDRWGRVERPLDLAEAERAVERLVADGVTSLAVCFINAYADDRHERLVGDLVRRRFPDLALSLSSEVLPEIREYERTSTTVINAYLMPTVRRYLHALADDLQTLGIAAPLLIMQSNGGVMPARAAGERPIHIVESGPAAGVVASARLACELNLPDVLTFDMGGTTAKASIIEGGRLSQTAEYEVGGGLSATSRLIRGGGYALRAPVIDIAEVGAGGGSLVWIDRGGALQVGPQSAGADPGPACYGPWTVDRGPWTVDRGAGAAAFSHGPCTTVHGPCLATVTDANVVLGYLNPAYLCGGEVPIDAERARAALAAHVAQPLGLDLAAAAYGVHLVANSNMQRALRAVSTQRGRDPRGYTLFAFGGNGPVHAAGLARLLQMRRVVVPPAPGLFSAHGLLLAEIEHHYVRTFFRNVAQADPAELNRALAALEAEALATLASEGYAPGGPAGSARLRRFADLRYARQSFELTVPLAAGPLDPAALTALAERFAEEHERTYGHRDAPGHPVDLVNLRLVATGLSADRRLATPARSHAEPRATPRGSRRAYFGPAGWRETPLVDRSDLRSGAQPGPLIVEEYDTTIVVPPGCSAHCDQRGNVVMEIEDV